MAVQLSFLQARPAEARADLLVVAATGSDVDKGRLVGAALRELDRALGGVLSSAAAPVELDARPNGEVVVHTHGKLAAERLAVVGVGRGDLPDRAAARLAGARAARLAEKLGARKAALAFTCDDEPMRVECAVEGALLGAYRFDRYQTEPKPRRLEEFSVVVRTAPSAALRGAMRLGEATGEAVCFARDLVNEPASALGPEELARAAAAMARRSGLRCEVHGREAIRRLRMGMLLSVAQGSHREPRLVHLRYEPPGRARRAPLVLVGKAVTFDSGGLSIKGADGMEDMKADMAGAAAVLGAMRLVGLLRPPFPVHAIMGACENMPGGGAQRPGDIVKGRAGRTVEVVNTDAEGRLVLADVLAAAAELKPAAIVDVATLTAAISVALGPGTAGLFSTGDALADEVCAAAEEAGEDVWRMPLSESLRELIKSPVADLKNTGGRKGGAITAALFLREFAGDAPWAHLDMAGCAMTDKERPLDARGATGFGVRTLAALVRGRMVRPFAP